MPSMLDLKLDISFPKSTASFTFPIHKNTT
jgi:hypothetical protein